MAQAARGRGDYLVLLQGVTPGSYAYSSMTVLPDKSIGLLYEGESGQILFTRFNLDWIKNP
ncbi:hypothetical protein ACI48J_07555 [Paenibacillus chitinolyticus]|uniref:hypothetical protein n=1 Tax=Paenibacillus chitinolyticus TaxID=79263 RepID=UPI003869D433